MKFNLYSIFLIIIVLVSCSKEDDFMKSSLKDFSYSKYVYKIIPGTEGYWLITRTVQNPECESCSNLNLIEGLAFFYNDDFFAKDKIGFLLDAEEQNNSLITITSNEVLSFTKNLQKTVLKTSENSEIYKLMDLDRNGKCWILSSKGFFNLQNDRVSFQNNQSFIDFEISDDNTFWVATNDTVFHVSSSSIEKFSIKEISGNLTSSIYNLSIDKNNDVWLNISDRVFKLNNNSWNDVKAGNYLGGNFQTIPYMDVDKSGKLWLAEKNYQSFTDLHCFDGSKWTSFTITPPLDNWINDIESAEPGFIWIATDYGLKKVPLDL